MRFKELWEKNIPWLLALWLGYGILVRPGWLVFIVGMAAWLLLLVLTAPGVFWTYVYLLPANLQYDPEGTLSKLQKVVAKEPSIALPYSSLGIGLAKAKRWHEAVGPLKEAIRLSSRRDRTELRLILAVAFREMGAYSEAFQVLDQLVADGIKNVKVYYNYALSYLRNGRLDEALKAVEKARSLDLNSVEPVLLMARIRFARGEYSEAKQDYEWAIAHTKWPVESFYWLGRAEFELGEMDTSVNHLQTAVERIASDPLLSDVTVFEASTWLEKAQMAGRIGDGKSSG